MVLDKRMVYSVPNLVNVFGNSGSQIRDVESLVFESWTMEFNAG